MPIRITNDKIYFNDGSFVDTANINAGDGIPSGTRMFFYQTNAPTNWTKVISFNNTALRVVNGTVSSFTTGMTFTSAFTSRTPSGNVSISVNNHSSSTLNSSPSISVSSSTISGLSFDTVTINNSSGTETFDITTNFHAFTGQITSIDSISGWINIEPTNASLENHSHSTPNTDFTISFTTGSIRTDELGIPYNIVDDLNITKNYTNTNTGTFSFGDPPNYSSHAHGNTGLSFSTHNHLINPQHAHDPVSLNVPVHNHLNYSISGSFDFSGSHNHLTSGGSHNHSITLSHTASGTFIGNPMDFSVKYVDLILAQKD